MSGERVPKIDLIPRVSNRFDTLGIKLFSSQRVKFIIINNLKTKFFNKTMTDLCSFVNTIRVSIISFVLLLQILNVLVLIKSRLNDAVFIYQKWKTESCIFFLFHHLASYFSNYMLPVAEQEFALSCCKNYRFQI